jgi:hypothetical protein
MPFMLLRVHACMYVPCMPTRIVKPVSRTTHLLYHHLSLFLHMLCTCRPCASL